MSDTNSKLINRTTTYISGGKSIAFNAPNFNLTLIENVMRNSSCLANIEPPKQILVNEKPDENTVPSLEGNESGAYTHTISILMVVLSVVFTTILF